MLRFLVICFLFVILVLLIFSIVIFVIIQVLLGNYLDYICLQLINLGGVFYEQVDVQVKVYVVLYGFDKLMVVQYFNWIGVMVMKGDFGYSMYYNRLVGEIVVECLLCMFLFVFVCYIFVLVFGIFFGVLVVMKQYSWLDMLLLGVVFFGMIVLCFFMVLIMVYLFVFQFNMNEIGNFFLFCYGGVFWFWDKFVDFVRYVWLVVVIVIFGGFVYNMWVMCGNLFDMLNVQYIEMVCVKGLCEGVVIMCYVVLNVLYLFIMYQGVVLFYMFMGEIEVVIIFVFLIVGFVIVDFMYVGDVYVIVMFMLVFVVILIIGNIIVDMLLVVFDLCVRLGGVY